MEKEFENEIKLAAYFHWLKTGQDELTCWLVAKKEVEYRKQPSISTNHYFKEQFTQKEIQPHNMYRRSNR